MHFPGQGTGFMGGRNAMNVPGANIGVHQSRSSPFQNTCSTAPRPSLQVSQPRTGLCTMLQNMSQMQLGNLMSFSNSTASTGKSLNHPVSVLTPSSQNFLQASLSALQGSGILSTQQSLQSVLYSFVPQRVGCQNLSEQTTAAAAHEARQQYAHVQQDMSQSVPQSVSWQQNTPDKTIDDLLSAAQKMHKQETYQEVIQSNMRAGKFVQGGQRPGGEAGDPRARRGKHDGGRRKRETRGGGAVGRARGAGAGAGAARAAAAAQVGTGAAATFKTTGAPGEGGGLQEGTGPNAAECLRLVEVCTLSENMMGKMKSHSEIAASHNRDQYFDEDLSSSANFPPFGEKDSQIDISTSSKTCQTKSRAKENPNRQLKASRLQQARSKKVSETNSTKQDDEEKLSRARSLQTSAEQENGRENEKVSNSSRSGRKRKLAPGLRDDSFEFGGKFIPMLTVAADEEMRNSELSRYLDVCSEFGSKLRESVKKLVYDQFVGSLKRCTSLKGCLAVLQGFMREIPMEHVKDQHEAIFEDWRKEFKLSHTPESLKSCLNAFIEEFVDLDEIMRENSRKRKKNTERKLAAQASVGDYSARSKETMEKEEKEKEEKKKKVVGHSRHRGGQEVSTAGGKVDPGEKNNSKEATKTKEEESQVSPRSMSKSKKHVVFVRTRLDKIVKRIHFAAFKNKEVSYWNDFHQKLKKSNSCKQIADLLMLVESLLLPGMMTSSWKSQRKTFIEGCENCDDGNTLRRCMEDFRRHIHWSNVGNSVFLKPQPSKNGRKAEMEKSGEAERKELHGGSEGKDKDKTKGKEAKKSSKTEQQDEGTLKIKTLERKSNAPSPDVDVNCQQKPCSGIVEIRKHVNRVIRRIHYPAFYNR
eukprot:759470-Hanusia_phi.AAC.1